jgi:hypothetical protein
VALALKLPLIGITTLDAMGRAHGTGKYGLRDCRCRCETW